MTTLVRLYPRAWRERYEAEFLGILEARPPSGRDRLDIVRGALDARLHPEIPGSPESPRPVTLATRAVGVTAIVAGLAWLAWAALILGDPRWLTSGESRNAGLMVVTAAVVYLALAAVHAALAVLGGGGSARQEIGAISASIAVLFFVLSGLGVWWSPVFAILASIAFAMTVAGRTIPSWLAATWAATSILALGVFLGGVGDAFGSLSVLAGAIPFGLFWILLGATVAVRGIASPTTVPDGSG